MIGQGGRPGWVYPGAAETIEGVGRSATILPPAATPRNVHAPPSVSAAYAEPGPASGPHTAPCRKRSRRWPMDDDR